MSIEKATKQVLKNVQERFPFINHLEVIIIVSSRGIVVAPFAGRDSRNLNESATMFLPEPSMDDQWQGKYEVML